MNASRYWADLTTADFGRLDLPRTIAVLPVAATEQHGPHLPLSVDTAIVDAVVRASLDHVPADLTVLFLPTQSVGLSPEHVRFQGTLTLRSETIIRLWTDIAESVAASGISKLVLLNAHGGQVSVMDIVDDLDHGVLATRQMVEEKIGDDINYLLLLKGMLIDRISAAEKTK